MTLQLPQLRNYIDGTITTPCVDRRNTLRNPNNREPLQAQLSCSEEQVEAALVATQRADELGEWEHCSPGERAEVLDTIADRLEQPQVREQLAFSDAITTGAVVNITRRMAQLTPFVFRGAADYIRQGNLSQTLAGSISDVKSFRSPWGPALLISPWNGPTAIGAHKIASALAAGAPCIIKPSEWAPHSAVIMADIIHGLSLPRGTFGLTCGSRHIGGQMISDHRIKSVSFTGGLTGGRAIAAACGPDFKPTQLELGGNNPLIVFEDADLDRAATGIVYGLTNLNAQWCRALGRLLVHKSIKEALLERVSAGLAQIKLGDSLSEDSDMGPMVHRQQYQGIVDELERLQGAGGTLISTTPMPALPGYFIAPTLVDGCEPEDTRDEIFGPVATIHEFETDAEALRLANGTPFGLAGYVYSANEKRAYDFASKMRTGGVKINGYSLFALSPEAPRGAWGRSGLGEEGTGQSIEFFTGSRVIGVSGQDPIGGRTS